MGCFPGIVLLISGLSALEVSAQSPQPVSKTHAKKATAKVQFGIASYYSDKFNGRSTANGEIFNQRRMTAASNTLPLNTWVRVINLHNKKTAIVKITDRMHPKNKRLIDLSKAAAKILDFLSFGLTRVKVEVLGSNRTRTNSK